MTNKEIRDNATPLIPFNGSFFVDQDFINMYEANDTEEACEMALDIIQDLTRADERERVISEIEKMLGPKLVTLYQSELAIENYKSEFRAKLNSLKP